jgi:hypothetical protein
MRLPTDEGIPIRALHSELFSEHSSWVSSRNEFSRVGTSSEKARKTRSDPNFRITAISKTRSDPNFWKVWKKVRNFWVGTSFVVKNGHFWSNLDSKWTQNYRTFFRTYSRKLPSFGKSSNNSSRLEILVKIYFRNSQKQKFWQKPSNAGP